MKRVLLCSLAASAVLAMAASSADASSRKHHAKHHHHGKTWTHHRHFVYGTSRPFVRRSIDGALIDRVGWRFWNGQWDNTCFRTLDYLSSMSACSGGGA